MFRLADSKYAGHSVLVRRLLRTNVKTIKKESNPEVVRNLIVKNQNVVRTFYCGVNLSR